MAVMTSSVDMKWSTPQAWFDYLDLEFDFTLDPCCTHKTAKCAKHFTSKEDGLSKSWGDETVFMNPPYGREIGKWVKKAYEASLKGAKVVCLIPARTDTKWWYKYCLKASGILFVKGRIKFECDGKPLGVSAPFPSCFVIFDSSYHTSRCGQIYPGIEANCYWVDLTLGSKDNPITVPVDCRRIISVSK